jgi:hypothetical protein
MGGFSRGQVRCDRQEWTQCLADLGEKEAKSDTVAAPFTTGIIF